MKPQLNESISRSVCCVVGLGGILSPVGGEDLQDTEGVGRETTETTTATDGRHRDQRSGDWRWGSPRCGCCNGRLTDETSGRSE